MNNSNAHISATKRQSILPLIDQSLRYQNQYENYEDEFETYNNQNAMQGSGANSPLQLKNSLVQQMIHKQTLKGSDNGQYSQNFQPQQNQSMRISKTQKIQLSNNSGINAMPLQYRNKKTEQISREIKQMRKELHKINQQLNQKLDFYTLSMNEFQNKQLMTRSKREFYEKQIETNKKVQEAQNQELQKLMKSQNQVKDKDLLLDLEAIVNEVKYCLSTKQKEEYQEKLKIFRKDKRLDVIIKENEDQKYNNLWKILKLQIVYSHKKLAHLKIYQEQLEHEQNSIIQNDGLLNKKLQEFQKSKYFPDLDYSGNHKYQALKKRYTELKTKRDNIKLGIETEKKSKQIFQEKSARALLKMDDELAKIINPTIVKVQEGSQILAQKCEQLMKSYGFADSSLDKIKHKFSEDITYHGEYTRQKKGHFKSLIKPNFKRVTNSKINSYKQQLFQPQTHRSRIVSNDLDIGTLKVKVKSNSNLAKFNDKNHTIDVINDEQKTPRHLSTIKPKNFLRRSANYSTLESTPKQQNNQISAKLLKPRMMYKTRK